jgi:hypothetical protein
MSDLEIYDKVSWHFPEGKDCPSLEDAKAHFIAVMRWLKENSLLSDEGEEALELGIDSDFSITSSMLNSKGNEVFDKYYADWLQSIGYAKKPNLAILDNGLKMLSVR